MLVIVAGLTGNNSKDKEFVREIVRSVTDF
jgi:hypothetical protein